ncbi:MAG: hypothetical protein WD874_00700 [Parcubacteria group bacterium]
MLRTEALKKTEKIASAVYLITGFFGDQEPLKWKLRELCSKLISTSFFIKDEIISQDDKYTQEAKEILSIISSLFLVAKNTGLVSEMNHSILTKEISKLSNTIGPAREAVSAPNPALLSDKFFSVENEKPLGESVEAPLMIKDKTKPELISEHDYKPQTPAKEKELREFGAVAVKKTGRQSVIINLLKRKKEIMIKDVSPLIEGVSEKTIQRELLSMVKSGILRKQGEKRWSRYSLA